MCRPGIESEHTSSTVISEISPDKFELLPPIKTQIGARTMALDPKSGRIYLVTADMSVGEAAGQIDHGHRYHVKPGSVRLLFLDWTP